jgi:general secretion pathway protein J
MAGPGAPIRQAEAGFTLIEALVAVALMGLILSALAVVTGQWLSNWNRGLFRVQRNEKLAIVLDRLVADLTAAEYVSGSRLNKSPLFEGTETGVTFVRSALGPNTRPGLEIVRIAETADSGGPILVRTRAPFVPMPVGDPSVDQIPFADPVVLLRPPFRVVFSYAAANGKWGTTWQGQGVLPNIVRMSLDEMNGDWAPVVATAARIRVEMAAPQPPSEQQPAPAAQDAQAQQRGSPAGGTN